MSNPRDIVKLDVPLFIRLLEYAKEDAQTDMDLHQLADNVIEMCSEGRTLSMDDYDYLLPDQEERELREYFRRKMG
jgi:hypothetical protein